MTETDHRNAPATEHGVGMTLVEAMGVEDDQEVHEVQLFFARSESQVSFPKEFTVAWKASQFA